MKISRAFSLIEILVVVAILSLLAALLFPVFARSKSAAKETVCATNLKNLHLAFTLYAGDWEDAGPRIDAPAELGGTYFGVVLAPWIKSTEILRCPLDRFLEWEKPGRPPVTHATHWEEDGGSYTYNGRDLAALGSLSNAPNPGLLFLVRDTAPFHRPEPFGPINTAFFDGHVRSVPWYERDQNQLPDPTP